MPNVRLCVKGFRQLRCGSRSKATGQKPPDKKLPSQKAIKDKSLPKQSAPKTKIPRYKKPPKTIGPCYKFILCLCQRPPRTHAHTNIVRMR